MARSNACWSLVRLAADQRTVRVNPPLTSPSMMLAAHGKVSLHTTYKLDEFSVPSTISTPVRYADGRSSSPTKGQGPSCDPTAHHVHRQRVLEGRAAGVPEVVGKQSAAAAAIRP